MLKDTRFLKLEKGSLLYTNVYSYKPVGQLVIWEIACLALECAVLRRMNDLILHLIQHGFRVMLLLNQG